MANLKVKARNTMTIPPVSYISWFSENQEIYENYVNGEKVIVPEQVADALDCEVVEENKGAEEVEESEEVEQKEFEITADDLMEIDGIGEKRANEILESYEEYTELVKDIQSDSLKVEVSDNIMEQLKEHYKDIEFSENTNEEREMNE